MYVGIFCISFLFHLFDFQSQVGPASQDLTNEKSYKTFLEGDDVGVVGYFEKDDSPLAAAYLTVTKKLRGKVRFAHTSTKELLESAGHKYVPLRLVKGGELLQERSH